MTKTKFRVWDKKTNELYHSTQLVIRPYSGDITDGSISLNDKVDLEMCTGEKIGYGKGIKDVYEGDIIYFMVSDCFDNVRRYTGTVVFYKGGFEVKCEGQDYDGGDTYYNLYSVLYNDDEAKIIGDTHKCKYM